LLAVDDVAVFRVADTEGPYSFVPQEKSWGPAQGPRSSCQHVSDEPRNGRSCPRSIG
jgi:hypothetical protein